MTDAARASEALLNAIEEWDRAVYKKTTARTPERELEFTTTSFVPVNPLYTPADMRGGDYLEKVGFPGRYPFTRGIQPTMYRGRLWTMRQYAGFGTGRGIQRALPVPARAGADRGSRSRSTCRRRSGTTATRRMADGEVGKVGVAIDTLADMETALRRDPARQGLHLDDHQRPRADAARHVHRGRREAGREAVRHQRHDSERHPEGVHRPRDVHLPPEAVDAAHHRHLRILRQRSPEVEHDLDLRVSHPRGGLDRRAGGGVHARRRDRLCRTRRSRPAWMWTPSRASSRSSSTRTTIFSKRWRSTGPRAGSGRAS